MILNSDKLIKKERLKRFLTKIPSTPCCVEMNYSFYEEKIIYFFKFALEYECKSFKDFINTSPKSKKFFGEQSQGMFFKIIER